MHFFLSSIILTKILVIIAHIFSTVKIIQTICSNTYKEDEIKKTKEIFGTLRCTTHGNGFDSSI